MAPYDGMTSPEAAASPVDHQYPIHPYYPRDLEHQTSPGRSFLSKKRLLIAGSIAATILVMTAGVIWGVALTRNNDDKGAKDPVTTTVANVSTTMPLAVKTAFENATTFVYSTTRIPLLPAPSLATSTIIHAPTAHVQVMLDAPLRSVLAGTVPVLILEAPAPADAITSGTSSKNCLFDGAWVLKEQCEKHCGAWEGYERHCEVSKRSQWVCVSCPT